jgi:hypothetical protein
MVIEAGDVIDIEVIIEKIGYCILNIFTFVFIGKKLIVLLILEGLFLFLKTLLWEWSEFVRIWHGLNFDWGWSFQIR